MSLPCKNACPDLRIKAYLFDLDGTLIDSEQIWVAAVARMIKHHGKTVEIERVGSWVVGRSWTAICHSIFNEWSDFPTDILALEEEVRVYYLDIRSATDIRIPSSIALLQTLARHTPVVIVSGSPRADIAEAIEMMGIGDCISFFLGDSDYPRGKPDPCGFHTAAERLGVEPAQCVVFEDSSAGVLAGHLAGMKTVALARPGHVPQDTRPANLVLADLSEYSPELLFADGAKSGRGV